jgi:hypothetical protein
LRASASKCRAAANAALPPRSRSPDASFKFCPTCGEEIHEVESAQAFGPPLRLTERPAPAGAPPEPERPPTDATNEPNLAAEVAALRRVSEEREARSAKTRQWILAGLLILVLALFGLWETGRMDTTLAGIGLNKNDCIKNGFGATFCGNDAKKYEQNLQSIQNAVGASSDDLSAAESAARATVPSVEAHYSDQGTYVGMTVSYLRQNIDSQISQGVSLHALSAGSYCIEATVGSATASYHGPGAAGVQDGPC